MADGVEGVSGARVREPDADLFVAEILAGAGSALVRVRVPLQVSTSALD